MLERLLPHCWLYLVLAVVAPSGHAGGPVFWVGAAAPCNFNSLHIAIAAVPDGAVLRIANNQNYDDVNVAIVNKSLTLEGGWDDCTGTAPTTQPAELVGAPDAGEPVLLALSNSIARQVQLRRLHVRGGTRSGIESVGPVLLRVEDSRVDESTAATGGGLRVADGGQAELIRSVFGTLGEPSSTGNVATLSGGGIGCQQSSLFLDRVLVHDNQSSNGGGLNLHNCQVHSGALSWQPDGVPRHTVMIAGNSATARGGGLRATGATSIHLGEFALAPVLIDDNQSGFDGGGLSLDGAQVSFRGHAVQLSDNRAASLGGGGARVSDGASLVLDRPNWINGRSAGREASVNSAPLRGGGHYCLSARPCNEIKGNRIDAGTGSAISLNASTVLLGQTRITGNGQGAGIPLLVSGGGQLRLSSTLIDGNEGGFELIRVIGGSQLRISDSTIAGNGINTSVVRLFSDPVGNSVHLLHSIVWQPGTSVIFGSAVDTVVGSCLNAHEDVSLPAVTDDPGFVDASGGDYRLRGNSVNVDACDDLFQGLPAFDLIGTGRPVDLGRPDSPGPADRGAYELGDLIFANGFELLVMLP